MARSGMGAVTGLLQGFRRSADRKRKQAFEEAKIKVLTQQYKQKLEDDRKQRELKAKLAQRVAQMGRRDPSSMPPMAIGGGGQGRGPAPAPQTKPVSLAQLLADEQVRGLGLQSGLLKMGDLVDFERNQALAKEKEREASYRERNQSFLEGVMGGGGGGGAPGSGPRFEPSGVNVAGSGDVTIALKPSEQAASQTIGASTVVEAQQLVSQVAQSLTGGVDIDDPAFEDSIDLGAYVELATRIGSGTEMYDKLVTAATSVIFQRAGKTLSKTEAALVLDPLIPSVADARSMLSVKGGGPLMDASRIRKTVANKLRRLQSLVSGAMDSAEVRKLLAQRGIKLSPEEFRASTRRAAPGGGNTVEYTMNADGQLVDPQGNVVE